MPITKESVRETLDSYQLAVEGVLDIAGVLNVDGGCNGFQCYTPTSFSAHMTPEHAAPHLTAVQAKHESLFDYSRPKVFTGREWIWKSDFFRVRGIHARPFSCFSWEHERVSVDEDGSEVSRVAAGIRERGSYRVTLVCFERRYGLSQWKQKQDEIRGLFDGAPEGVRNDYAERLAAASRDVAKWEDAMRATRATEIPA